MRNFFHNISDVLLAAFIVVIAAGVIFWRINIIMKYPEMMSGAARTQVEESADSSSGSSLDANDEPSDN